MKLLDRIKQLRSSTGSRATQRKTIVAADLAIVISKARLKRKDVAQRLGITEAALSIRLNGTSNLTLESIGSICDVAGCDFDVVFRKAHEPAALSFWEFEVPESDKLLSDVLVRQFEEVEELVRRLGEATDRPHYNVPSFNHAGIEVAANDCSRDGTTSSMKYA